MKIRKVAVGNTEVAFVEKNLTDGVNIISSDDNNKGKTIVIQSMMYAMGNEPVFPVSFDYHQYSYYVEFEVNGNVYYLCRKGNTFVLKNGTLLMLFDNTSELKRYWSKYIFELPVIMKNNTLQIADPVLFLQIFFIGQDKKDTSNVLVTRYYNKQDFIEMLYYYTGIENSGLSQDEINEIRQTIKDLNAGKATLLKQHTILKSQNPPVSYLSSTSDRLAFEAKVAQMEKHRDKIESLKKERNRITNKRMKWQTTLKELNSLNRTIECGELRCMDCNSTHISFTTGQKKQNSYAFDVSTVELRTEIINSIKEKIAAYNEEIEKLTGEIGIEQRKLNEAMENESVTLEELVIYHKDVFSAADAEKRISEIESRIASEQTKLKTSDNASESAKQKKDEFFHNTVQSMNEYYHRIDSDSEEDYSNIFTDKATVYSGSEATVFHISKLLALQKVLNHDFPIVIDSFRAEDLSTPEEKRVLELFCGLHNQSILTTTLKTEELGKYNDLESINHIDYDSHLPNHLLQPEYVAEMKELLSVLSLEL